MPAFNSLCINYHFNPISLNIYEDKVIETINKTAENAILLNRFWFIWVG